MPAGDPLRPGVRPGQSGLATPAAPGEKGGMTLTTQLALATLIVAATVIVHLAGIALFSRCCAAIAARRDERWWC